MQKIAALAARDGAPQSVFEAIMDTMAELRAMDAAAAEWQDGRPEKMLHLLALKPLMHCYRCGKTYYTEDGKRVASHTIRKMASGPRTSRWQRSQCHLTTSLVSAVCTRSKLRLKSRRSDLKVENAWIKLENDLVHNYLHKHVDQQEQLQREVNMLTLQAGMTPTHCSRCPRAQLPRRVFTRCSARNSPSARCSQLNTRCWDSIWMARQRCGCTQILTTTSCQAARRETAWGLLST